MLLVLYPINQKSLNNAFASVSVRNLLFAFSNYLSKLVPTSASKVLACSCQYLLNFLLATCTVVLAPRAIHVAYEMELKTSTLFTTIVPVSVMDTEIPAWGMLSDFLLGNLSACYMPMRIVLEAIVDATIANTRFSDFPTPDDLERLKSYMEKGGLTMRTFKCPECGAPIKLPESGNQVICEHCGSTVYAQDIFEKVKALIG